MMPLTASRCSERFCEQNRDMLAGAPVAGSQNSRKTNLWYRFWPVFLQSPCCAPRHPPSPRPKPAHLLPGGHPGWWSTDGGGAMAPQQPHHPGEGHHPDQRPAAGRVRLHDRRQRPGALPGDHADAGPHVQGPAHRGGAGCGPPEWQSGFLTSRVLGDSFGEESPSLPNDHPSVWGCRSRGAV